MESAVEDPAARSKYALLHNPSFFILNIQWCTVYYFRQGPLISNIKVIEIMEVICRCLDDEVVEVREMAAT